MKKTLNMIIGEILSKNKKKQYTAHELAEIVMKTEHDFVIAKIKKTGKTDTDLLFQFMSEIAAQHPNMKKFGVAKTAVRPYKYYYDARVKEAVKARAQEVIKALTKEKNKLKAAAKAKAKKAKAKK